MPQVVYIPLKGHHVTFFNSLVILPTQNWNSKPQIFTNVNNIWLQSTSKTHVSTYKLFLVSRVVSLFVNRPVKKLHSAPLN